MRISDWSADVCSSDLIDDCRCAGVDRQVISAGHALAVEQRMDLNGLRTRLGLFEPEGPEERKLLLRPAGADRKAARGNPVQIAPPQAAEIARADRKSTRLNSSH